MGDWSGDDAAVDVCARLMDDMAEELRVTHQRLAGALTDVQEVTNTAMDLASRLDACEKSLVETLREQEETLREREVLEEVRGAEVQELRSIVSDQADTISRQAAYITRLRNQVRRPLRIVAKRVLHPFTSILGREEKQ